MGDAGNAGDYIPINSVKNHLDNSMETGLASLAPSASSTPHPFSSLALGDEGTATVLVVAGVSTLLALFGNAAVPSLTKGLDTPMRWLAVSMAVANLILAVAVTMPIAAIRAMAPDWPLGHVGCKVFTGAMSLNGMVQLLSLLGLCVDRYLAMISPMKYQAQGSERYAVSVVVIVWGAALLITVPAVAHDLDGNEWTGSCEIPQLASYSSLLPPALLLAPYLLSWLVLARLNCMGAEVQETRLDRAMYRRGNDNDDDSPEGIELTIRGGGQSNDEAQGPTQGLPREQQQRRRYQGPYPYLGPVERQTKEQAVLYEGPYLGPVAERQASSEQPVLYDGPYLGPVERQNRDQVVLYDGPYLGPVERQTKEQELLYDGPYLGPGGSVSLGAGLPAELPERRDVENDYYEDDEEDEAEQEPRVQAVVFSRYADEDEDGSPVAGPSRVITVPVLARDSFRDGRISRMAGYASPCGQVRTFPYRCCRFSSVEGAVGGCPPSDDIMMADLSAFSRRVPGSKRRRLVTLEPTAFEELCRPAASPGQRSRRKCQGCQATVPHSSTRHGLCQVCRAPNNLLAAARESRLRTRMLANRRALALTTALMMVCTCCWMPIGLIHQMSGRWWAPPPGLTAAATWLYHSAAALVPIVFAYYNAEVREKVDRMLR